jgi:hypothetical protein
VNDRIGLEPGVSTQKLMLVDFGLPIGSLVSALAVMHSPRAADCRHCFAELRINERNEPQQLLSVSTFQKRIERFPRQTYELRKPT